MYTTAPLTPREQKLPLIECISSQENVRNIVHTSEKIYLETKPNTVVSYFLII